MKSRWLKGLSIAAVALSASALPALADTAQLTGVIRDFKRGDQAGGHTDFETCNTVSGHGSFGHVIGLVGMSLGSDSKPVWSPTRPSNDSAPSKTLFDQWFNDVAGVNQGVPYTLVLDNGKSTPGGVYSYSSSAFFPIDGQLFGNQGQKDASGKVRNFSFTFELHTEFTYVAGQNFKFTGDDDVWVYINGSKVLDLGGVHSAISGNVILFDGKAFIYNASTPFPVGGVVQSVSSSQATSLASAWSAANLGTCPIKSGDRFIDLGLKANQKCTLDFFFAERHVTESNFRIDTSLVLKTNTKIAPLYD